MPYLRYKCLKLENVTYKEHELIFNCYTTGARTHIQKENKRKRKKILKIIQRNLFLLNEIHLLLFYLNTQK